MTVKATGRSAPAPCSSRASGPIRTRWVQDPVLHGNVRIGRGATVRGAVPDRNVEVPPGATTGVNPERDAELRTVSRGGVIAPGRGQRVP